MDLSPRPGRIAGDDRVGVDPLTRDRLRGMVEDGTAIE